MAIVTVGECKRPPPHQMWSESARTSAILARKSNKSAAAGALVSAITGAEGVRVSGIAGARERSIETDGQLMIFAETPRR